jgi:hypothetical protein
MKHALSAALILLLGTGLIGCAADHEAAYEQRSYASAGATPSRQRSEAITTGSLPPAVAAPDKQGENFQFTRDQLQRNERRVYAQGRRRSWSPTAST